MTTPLVDWNTLLIPPICQWLETSYGFLPVPDESHARATALLLSHLNEQQRAEYTCMRRFAMRGGASGVVYVMGMDLYPSSVVENSIINRYCAPPHYTFATPDALGCARGFELPMEDIVLTWKLFIEADESGFLEIAQRNDVRAYVKAMVDAQMQYQRKILHRGENEIVVPEAVRQELERARMVEVENLMPAVEEIMAAVLWEEVPADPGEAVQAVVEPKPDDPKVAPEGVTN